MGLTVNVVCPIFLLVMNVQEKRYLLEFDKIHKLAEYSIALYSEKPKEERRQKISDDFIDYLILAYALGITEASEILGEKITPDSERMYAAIYKRIADKTISNRIDEYTTADDEYGLMRLIDSEFHRVYNTAIYDAAEQAEGNGKVIIKRWNTMLDDRVRDTHDYLEGVEVGLDERFYTYDGDSARFPGDFELAQNVANCRCYLTFYAL